MRNTWQMWESEISHSDCNELIAKLTKIDPTEAKIFTGNNVPEVRKSSVRWVHDPDIHMMMYRYANEANRLAFGFDMQPTGNIQFTEYNSQEEGHYDWHHDVNWESDHAFDRKVSVVIQLSDPDLYTGCDFEFHEVPNPEQKALRAKGTVICFPSYLRHRVTKITEGTRYSLVAWFEGPKWR